MNCEEISKIKCNPCGYEFEVRNNTCQRGGETCYFCPNCGIRIDKNGKRKENQNPLTVQWD